MAKTKSKAAAPVEDDAVDVDDTDEDVELELDDTDADTDGDVEEDVKPAKGKGKAKSNGQEEVEFGASDLAKYLSERLGKTITPRDLRTQIRRMARETERKGGPRVEREITAGNRTRYNWPGGLKNAEVKAIIAAVEGGELDAGKKAALDALKEKKAAQKAAGEGGKKGKAGKKGKKAKVEEIEVDDDDE